MAIFFRLQCIKSQWVSDAMWHQNVQWHCQNWCYLNVNRAVGNNVQWNMNQNTYSLKIYSQKSRLENVSLFFRSQRITICEANCITTSSWSCAYQDQIIYQVRSELIRTMALSKSYTDTKSTKFTKKISAHGKPLVSYVCSLFHTACDASNFSR